MQDAEAVGEKELRRAGHACAVVAQAVKQDNCVAVAAVRVDFPCAKDGRVGRGDGNVAEIGIEMISDFPHYALSLRL